MGTYRNYIFRFLAQSSLRPWDKSKNFKKSNELRRSLSDILVIFSLNPVALPEVGKIMQDQSSSQLWESKVCYEVPNFRPMNCAQACE